MLEEIRILFLEDELLDVELVSSHLEQGGLHCQIIHVRDRPSFEKSFESGKFDIILSDYSIPGYSGFKALQHVRARSPILPFILLSGTLSEEQAVESLKAGATDYIIKQRLNRLVPAIQRALEEAAEREELARAEAALKDSQERIRNQAALLDKARDAILLVDMDHRIRFWNKSAERIFGWTAAEALGNDIETFLIRGSLMPPGAILEKLLKDDEWRGELSIETRNGRHIIVESRWSLLRDPESPEPKGILLINTDVTEKKEMEAQIYRTQRIETVGALSGGIAHDLNNALAPIVMATELLADDVSSENGLRMLEMVRNSGKRCADMVKQILNFSRGANQGWELLDPCKIIEELAGLARETFPRLIRIESQCEPHLSPFLGNLTQIHQVIMNLLVNARDAMPRGGTITITARNLALRDHKNKMLTKPASGDFISIAVSDMGTGIAPEIRERIFEPYFTTKPHGKGTGLGLSTVFSIIKNHDGFLELRSELGKGTTFELFFPAHGKTERREQRPAVQPEMLSNGEQVLMIDDEAGLLAIVKTTLETLGYRVLTATDGLEALEIVEKKKNQIDLVMTDWVMPLMSGSDLVRRIRAIAPEMKIVVVTGSGVLESDGLDDVTIQGVLQKPYSTEALLTGIQRALRAPLPSF
jgi:two-component system cell cycle sensor histidine kinase/response regulator CckA